MKDAMSNNYQKIGGFHKNSVLAPLAAYGWVLFKFQGRKRPILYCDLQQSQEGSYSLLASTSLDGAVSRVGDEWTGVAWVREKEPILFRVQGKVLYPLRPLTEQEYQQLLLRFVLGEVGAEKEEHQDPQNDPIVLPAKKPLFATAAELLANPQSPDWLIKGWMARDSFSIVFGDPAAGKSFLSIDWACHISTGRWWNLNRVKPGVVLYICGEGHGGIARRIAAWVETYGEIPELYVSTRAITLDAEGASEVMSEIQALDTPIVLVIIDTLARAIAGDENSAESMGGFIRATDAIREQFKCAVLVVHHSGHGDKTRGRGHSSLKGAADAEFQLERADPLGPGTLKCTKVKDAEPPEPMAYQLQSVTLPAAWADPETREPSTSCVFTVLADQQPVRTNRRLSSSEKIVLNALNSLCSRTSGEHVQDVRIPGDTVRVSGDVWREESYRLGLGEGKSADARRVAFGRARDKLLAESIVCCDSGDYWIARHPADWPRE